MRMKNTMAIRIDDSEKQMLLAADACRRVLFDDPYYKSLTPEEQQRFRIWRSRFEKEELSPAKIENIITSHGYIVAQERLYKRVSKRSRKKITLRS